VYCVTFLVSCGKLPTVTSYIWVHCVAIYLDQRVALCRLTFAEWLRHVRRLTQLCAVTMLCLDCLQRRRWDCMMVFCSCCITWVSKKHNPSACLLTVLLNLEVVVSAVWNISYEFFCRYSFHWQHCIVVTLATMLDCSLLCRNVIVCLYL